MLSYIDSLPYWVIFLILIAALIVGILLHTAASRGDRWREAKEAERLRLAAPLPPTEAELRLRDYQNRGVWFPPGHGNCPACGKVSDAAMCDDDPVAALCYRCMREGARRSLTWHARPPSQPTRN